jgi:hypothetical protein
MSLPLAAGNRRNNCLAAGNRRNNCLAADDRRNNCHLAADNRRTNCRESAAGNRRNNCHLAADNRRNNCHELADCHASIDLRLKKCGSGKAECCRFLKFGSATCHASNTFFFEKVWLRQGRMLSFFEIWFCRAAATDCLASTFFGRRRLRRGRMLSFFVQPPGESATAPDGGLCDGRSREGCGPGGRCCA